MFLGHAAFRAVRARSARYQSVGLRSVGAKEMGKISRRHCPFERAEMRVALGLAPNSNRRWRHSVPPAFRAMLEMVRHIRGQAASGEGASNPRAELACATMPSTGVHYRTVTLRERTYGLGKSSHDVM